MLAETFGNDGIVARMGGDEFISVLRTANAEKVAALMEALQRNIDSKNREVEDLNLSMAFGYAFGMENGDDIEKVYQAADDKMYEHKKKMKENKEN